MRSGMCSRLSRQRPRRARPSLWLSVLPIIGLAKAEPPLSPHAGKYNASRADHERRLLISEPNRRVPHDER